MIQPNNTQRWTGTIKLITLDSLGAAQRFALSSFTRNKRRVLQIANCSDDLNICTRAVNAWKHRKQNSMVLMMRMNKMQIEKKTSPPIRNAVGLACLDVFSVYYNAQHHLNGVKHFMWQRLKHFIENARVFNFAPTRIYVEISFENDYDSIYIFQCWLFESNKHRFISTFIGESISFRNVREPSIEFEVQL